MTRVSRRTLLVALGLGAVVPALRPAHAVERQPLTIETAAGPVHKFMVELALTPADQAQGLMFRQSMEPQHGMLFVFQKEGPISVWMKNTFIPLDIIFIDGKGVVTKVHANAIPQDLTPIPSGGPAKAFLEINGGLAEKLGIRAGDTVRNSQLPTGAPD